MKLDSFAVLAFEAVEFLNTSANPPMGLPLLSRRSNPTTSCPELEIFRPFLLAGFRPFKFTAYTSFASGKNPHFLILYTEYQMNVIFDVKKDICKNSQSAIRGWKPFVLADEVWGSLAIGLAFWIYSVAAPMKMDVTKPFVRPKMIPP